MQQYLWLLSLFAAVIILGLSIYAGWLLSKLHKQKQWQEKVAEATENERNEKIIESVNIIALAAMQKQCDLSEAAIRLYMIMDHLQGSMRLDFSLRFPALFELYETVKDMPRGKARKALLKNERMRLDLQRAKSESKLEQSIILELEEMLIFTGAKKCL